MPTTSLADARPREVALSPDGSRLYASGADGVLRVYDISSGALVNSWQVGNSLGGLDLSPDGTFLLVVDRDIAARVYRVDTVTGATTSYHYSPADGGTTFFDVAVLSNGTALLSRNFSGSGYGGSQLLNLASGQFTTGPGIGQTSLLTRSADGTSVLVGEPNSSAGPLDIYRTGIGIVAQTGANGYNFGLQAFAPAGNLVAQYIYNEGINIYNATLQRQTILTGWSGGRVTDLAFDSIGQNLFVLDNEANAIVQLRVSDWSTVATIAIGADVGGWSAGQLGATLGNRLIVDPSGRYFSVATDTGLVLVANPASAYLATTGGPDFVSGLAFAETIQGGGGDDVLNGGGGDDQLFGGDGNDRLSGGLGRDLIDGGEGFDIVDYRYSTVGVAARLSDQSGNEDSLVSIEQVEGSQLDDLIEGGDGNDRLFGLIGNDVLRGGGGSDLIRGGTGDDVIDGGGGIDVAEYFGAAGGVTVDLRVAGPQNTIGAGVDTLIGIENVTGSLFDDTLIGTDGDNQMNGRGGVDALYGLGGNDVLWGYAISGGIDGGTGTDTLYYDIASGVSGITLDLAVAGPQQISATQVQTVSGIEILYATRLDDGIYGAADNEEIDGLAGNDRIESRAGNDVVTGGEGNDIIHGGDGDDVLSGDGNRDPGIYMPPPPGSTSFPRPVGKDELRGGAGNDTLYGGGGVDALYGGDGDDILWFGEAGSVLDGGAGQDRLSFSGIGFIGLTPTTQGLIIDLLDPQRSTGIAHGTQITSVEYVMATVAADELSGTNNAETLFGHFGNDVIDGRGGDDMLLGWWDADLLLGGSGDDSLDGGGGNDRLSGGAGVDTALFSGPRSDYQITNLGGGQLQVSGPDGIDLVSRVEQLQFGDRTIAAPTGLFAQRPEMVAPIFGASPQAGSWTDADRYPRTLADINGDGMADLIGFGNAGVYAALATGNGTFGGMYLATDRFGASAEAGSWTDADTYPRALADINGDGMADLIGFGNAGVYAALATGNGTFGGMYLATDRFGASAEAGSWTDAGTYPRMLADINGDGMADLVGFGNAGVYAALATGGGTFGGMYLATDRFGASAEAGSWTDAGTYPRTLADIDGDGMADLVGFGNAGVYAALATGSGTFGGMFLAANAFGASPEAGGWTNADTYPRALADIDGDGRADLIGFGNAGVYAALATGDGTFGAIDFDSGYFGVAGADSWASSSQFPRAFADVNGDGMADIVGFGNEGVHLSIATDLLLI